MHDCCGVFFFGFLCIVQKQILNTCGNMLVSVFLVTLKHGLEKHTIIGCGVTIYHLILFNNADLSKQSCARCIEVIWYEPGNGVWAEQGGTEAHTHKHRVIESRFGTFEHLSSMYKFVRHNQLCNCIRCSVGAPIVAWLQSWWQSYQRHGQNYADAMEKRVLCIWQELFVELIRWPEKKKTKKV